MRFTLPYPPSSNRYWKPAIIRGRPSIVPTPLAERYKTAIDELLRPELSGLLEEDVTLVVSLFRPRAAGDTSNRLKVLEDALNGVLWVDDRQVARIEIERFAADDGIGRVDVEVVRHQPRPAPPPPELSPAFARRLARAMEAMEQVRAAVRAKDRAKAEAREAAKGAPLKHWQGPPAVRATKKDLRVLATSATYRPRGRR